MQAGTHSREHSYPFPHLITFNAESDLLGEMREFGHRLPKPERSRSATIPLVSLGGGFAYPVDSLDRDCSS